MGLLGNGWDDPQSQAVMALAGGLLSGNFGQGAKDYGAIMGAAPDIALKRQMAKEELAMKQLAEKRAQAAFEQNQAFYKMFQGGDAPAGGSSLPASPMGPGATNSGTAGQLPNSGPAPQGTQLGGMVAGIPRMAALGELALNGGKNLPEWMYKQGIPDMQVSNGFAYDKNKLQGGFLPGMSVSQNGQASLTTIGPDGLPQVSAPRGAVDTAKAYKETEAGLDLVDVPMGDGTSKKMTRLDAAKLLSGGQTQGAQSGFSSADMAKIYADAASRGVTPDIRYTPGAGTFGRTQSPAEQARAVDTAKADVVRDTTKQGDAKRYGQLTATADRALQLLQEGPTASGIGSKVDSVYNFFGKSNSGADKAAELDTLSGWMTANVPRMEGPQSDKDVAQYKVMAAAVGDKTVPISQRIAAAKELKMLQDKYANLNGYAQKAEDAPKAAVMDAMPKANPSNKGRKIRDTETGKILQSNGMSWVEVK